MGLLDRLAGGEPSPHRPPPASSSVSGATDGRGSYGRVFRRHAHPVSAWSRLLTTPLLLLPLWTRRWSWHVPIGAWFALNPVMTPPVQDTSSFAARAILGEESWTRDPLSEPVVPGLASLASASLVGAAVASYRHRAVGTVVGTGVFMALTLCEWRLWAERFARESRLVES